MHTCHAGRSNVTTLDRFLQKDPKPGTQRPRSKKPSAMKPFGRGYWLSSAVTVPSASKDTSKLHVLKGEHPWSTAVGVEQGDRHKEKSLDSRPSLANPNKPRIVSHLLESDGLSVISTAILLCDAEVGV